MFNLKEVVPLLLVVLPDSAVVVEEVEDVAQPL